VLEVVEQFVTRKEGQPLLEIVAEAQKQEGTDHQFERSHSGATPIVATHRSKPKPSRKRSQIPVRIEPGRPWKQEQQAALKRLIHIDERRRVFLGSIEITELVRRQLEVEELASIAAQEDRGLPTALRIPKIPGVGISSPLGGEMKGRGRKFWFKVNAELIVYGATEPDARVTVADRRFSAIGSTGSAPILMRPPPRGGPARAAMKQEQRAKNLASTVPNRPHRSKPSKPCLERRGYGE
jgi:hypothetical protein